MFSTPSAMSMSGYRRRSTKVIEVKIQPLPSKSDTVKHTWKPTINLLSKLPEDLFLIVIHYNTINELVALEESCLVEKARMDIAFHQVKHFEAVIDETLKLTRIRELLFKAGPSLKSFNVYDSQHQEKTAKLCHPPVMFFKQLAKKCPRIEEFSPRMWWANLTGILVYLEALKGSCRLRKINTKNLPSLQKQRQVLKLTPQLFKIKFQAHSSADLILEYVSSPNSLKKLVVGMEPSLMNPDSMIYDKVYQILERCSNIEVEVNLAGVNILDATVDNVRQLKKYRSLSKTFKKLTLVIDLNRTIRDVDFFSPESVITLDVVKPRANLKIINHYSPMEVTDLMRFKMVEKMRINELTDFYEILVMPDAFPNLKSIEMTWTCSDIGGNNGNLFEILTVRGYLITSCLLLGFLKKDVVKKVIELCPYLRHLVVTLSIVHTGRRGRKKAVVDLDQLKKLSKHCKITIGCCTTDRHYNTIKDHFKDQGCGNVSVQSHNYYENTDDEKF